jgi:uncharacterized protein with FMN-binding domain
MDDTNNQTPAAPDTKGSSNAVKLIGLIIVVAVIAFLVWEFGLKGESSENNENMTVQPTVPAQTTSAPRMAAYRDGTYEATGEYTNPASREEIDVTITIADGKITQASFTGTPDNATTTRMQTNLRNGLNEAVVGKSIDEVNLTVVNGSSLAPRGFMDALSKIKAEAQS